MKPVTILRAVLFVLILTSTGLMSPESHAQLSGLILRNAAVPWDSGRSDSQSVDTDRKSVV